jgi:hypothetical protein
MKHWDVFFRNNLTLIAVYRVKAPTRPLANQEGWRRFNRDRPGYDGGLTIATIQIENEKLENEKPV